MPQEAEITEKVEGLLQEPVGALGYQLLDVQYRFEGQWILRLLIDKPEGISIDDCRAVSVLAGHILDVEDPVPSEFSLEVSSPGIFRPLKRPKDFQQAIGKMARFKLAPEAAEGGGKQTLRGMIVEVTESALLVNSEGKFMELPLEGIRSARLDPDL